MTGKTKKKAKSTQPEPGGKSLYAHELLTNPTILAGIAAEPFTKWAGDLDLTKYLTLLRDETKKVQEGDTKPIEAMLYGQAVALGAMFTSLTRRAQAQEYLKQFNAYMTLGLKAQAQCRATLEALAEVKNPRPVAFVKQANIAQGPQQVNNGPSPESSRAEEKPIVQNGLLPSPGVDQVPASPVDLQAKYVRLDAGA